MVVIDLGRLKRSALMHVQPRSRQYKRWMQPRDPRFCPGACDGAGLIPVGLRPSACEHAVDAPAYEITALAVAA